MEGLEITEITLSNLVFQNDRFRFDAEFLHKDYFEIEKQLNKNNVKFLNETDCIIIHPTEIKRNFVENGIWFFRTQNLRPLRIENSNDVYISETDAISLEKNNIVYGDVLITRTGANYGQTSIYDLKNTAIASSHVFVLRNSYFNQFYLAIFFNTKYGRKMIDKGMYGAAQPEIAPYYLEHIPIPDFSIDFQARIENVYNLAGKDREQSQKTYTKAESLLLQEIGLQNFTPSKESVNIKSFKESFGISGRLDAEYYQKKYDELIETINNINHKSLDNIVLIKKSIEPGSGAYQTEGIPFIRVSNITKFGISQPEIHLDRKVFSDEDLRPKKDTILLSKDGSVGIAYKVEQDLDVITSSALLHLTVTDKEILPDYLTLVLNSKLTQMQAERDAGGSIIQHWRPYEIKQVLIPVLPLETQQKIASLIQESFRLKEESENLLEVAKQAVEIAIEKDEQTAMKFIENRS